jgi:hypothetical protein
MRLLTQAILRPAISRRGPMTSRESRPPAQGPAAGRLAIRGAPRAGDPRGPSAAK